MENHIHKYKPSLSELVRSTTIYYKAVGSRRRGKSLAITMLVLGILSTTAHGFGWGTVACLIVAFALWFDASSIFTIAMIAVYLKKKNALLFRRIAFDESGLKITTDKSERNHSWDFYDQIIESNGLFLLVFKKDLYDLIPKRAFTSDRSFDSFRMVARNYAKRYTVI